MRAQLWFTSTNEIRHSGWGRTHAPQLLKKSPIVASFFISCKFVIMSAMSKSTRKACLGLSAHKRGHARRCALNYLQVRTRSPQKNAFAAFLLTSFLYGHCITTFFSNSASQRRWSPIWNNHMSLCIYNKHVPYFLYISSFFIAFYYWVGWFWVASVVRRGRF